MTGHAARREHPLARFARLARRHPADPDATMHLPVVPSGRHADTSRAERMAGETPAVRPLTPPPFGCLSAGYPPAPEVHHEPSPVHMVADEYGIMPCCGQHETQVPRADRVTANPGLVTWRRAARSPVPDDGLLHRVLNGLRALDASEPPVPDLCADLAGLPVFRETLGACTRRHFVTGDVVAVVEECPCGHQVTGETYGERMVRAGIHLLAGAA